MSKIVFLSPQKQAIANPAMLTFLKVMYYLGYLPFTWFDESNPEIFKISNWKTFFILIFDFLLGLIIPAYYYFWFHFNMGLNFDMNSLLNPSYYNDINDGLVTTALSQFIYVAVTTICFWVYSLVGEYFLILLKYNFR